MTVPIIVHAMLAIDPARQKAGIGRTLMNAAEEWCRAAGWLR